MHQSVHNFIQLDNAVSGLTVAEVWVPGLKMALITAFDLIAHRSIFADILLAGGRQRQPVLQCPQKMFPTNRELPRRFSGVSAWCVVRFSINSCAR